MEKASLEQRTLRQFDALFQFRAATSLSIKPILESNDPGRTEDRNAFSDDDPDFFLEHVGPAHTLILNKFCVVRPQYILHTNVFTPQSDSLSENDLSAAWSVFSRLEMPHIIIYNCGVEAGSSLGYKHLQILPRPPKQEFDFFPNTIGISEDTCTVPGIPFQHAVKRLSAKPSTSELVDVYQTLLTRANIGEAPAHNVIVVAEWMLVIPRVRPKQGGLSANAAAMVGMVWVTKTDVLQEWLDHGPMRALCGFGVVDDMNL
ncbi:uncharacterized protein BP5553_06675 [Venustampulla echinocandica]|uniref:Uncharacterized protein n=1 Tax=Venustampulla echinocandica TaxID=2656787 RepID=A0A370TKL3_9HELO|nr:uncharacterized protein BP5553_06675 [Venustampulla echinocandica]RDL36063.1 hypothetical protein BP5553_06675 [Venustampulla echinocandica]